MSHKFTLLGGLYVTQYLSMGFFYAGLPAILRAQGVPLEQLGFVYALGLIWTIKFLWAPLIDRFGVARWGHYRGWLLILQSLLVLTTLLTALFTPQEQLRVVLLLLALIVFLSATQDIAADALAVRLLAPEERGLGNSVQSAGGMIGNLLGGGVVLIAYEYLGWAASMSLLALGTALPLLLVWRHREPPNPAGDDAPKVTYGALLSLFREPGMGSWTPVLLLFYLGMSLAYALLSPMLVDLGWSLATIGVLVNVAGSLVGVLGALLAGGLVGRLGRKGAMTAIGILQVVAVAALFAPALGAASPALVYTAVSVQMLAWGANAAVVMTVLMDRCRPESAGTDFTTQYCVLQIGSTIVSGLGLGVAGMIGYAGAVGVGFGLTLLALVAVTRQRGLEPAPSGVLIGD